MHLVGAASDLVNQALKRNNGLHLNRLPELALLKAGAECANQPTVSCGAIGPQCLRLAHHPMAIGLRPREIKQAWYQPASPQSL
jgi:hypothetical protein